MLVEVKIQEQVPKHFYFENEKGILMQQEVVYEWEPVLCGKYKGYGRETNQCKKGTR